MTIDHLLNIIKQGEKETVEFKQSFNKTVLETLVAFANGMGGFLFVGIDDNGIISGTDINKESLQQWTNEIKQKTEPLLLPDVQKIEINGKSIIVFRMVEYPLKPVSVQGRYFIRRNNSNHQLSVDEIVELRLQSKNLSFDSFLTKSTFKDLNFDVVKSFTTKIGESGRFASSGNPEIDLKKLGLLEGSMATRAAELLFGNHNTSIHIGRFKTASTIIDDVLIKSPLVIAVDEAMNFIKRNIRIEYIFTGELKRVEKWQFSLQIIRELLLNSIIHRDYRSSSDVIIKIFDNHILFSNPGTLMGGLTVADLKTDNYQPKHRNKLLSEAFYLMGDVEKYGTGFVRIREWLKEYSDHSYNVDVLRDFFRVELWSKPDNNNNMVLKTERRDKLNDKLNDKHKQLIEYIRSHPGCQMKELSANLTIPYGSIIRYINYLQKKLIIERRGSRKTGGYWIYNSLNN